VNTRFGVAWSATLLGANRPVATRLLGVSVRRVTATAAAALGIGVAAVVLPTGASGWKDTPAGLLFAAVSAFTAVAATSLLGFLAAPADMEMHPGVTGPRPPWSLRRAARDRLSRNRRYLQLMRLAIRHRLGPSIRSGAGRGRSEQAAGSAVRAALQEAGGILVKFGQVQQGGGGRGA